MQASTKNAWVVMPLAFAMFVYVAYGLSQFDSDTTLSQWLAGIGAVTIFLLILFQSVKGLMHDMTWEENFPDK